MNRNTWIVGCMVLVLGMIACCAILMATALLGPIVWSWSVEQFQPLATTEPTIPSKSNPEPGSWNIEYFAGATSQMKRWGENLNGLSPELWRVFPNEPNPLVPEFRISDGLEYGEDETGYCEQEELCDLVVPPLHYRIVTGDYELPFDACKATDEIGCGFMIVNVGEVSTGLEDISVDFGFTVWGRYFNGEAMPMAIWGGLSKTANNMLHLESELNPHPLPNAGGNCSVPTGCPKARLAFFIMSGNELLMKGVTTVSR